MTRVMRLVSVALAVTLLSHAGPAAVADEARLIGAATTDQASGPVTLVPVPDGVAPRRLLAKVSVQSSSGAVPTGRLELIVAGRRVDSFPARVRTTVRTVVRRSDLDEQGMLPVSLRWVDGCAPPGVTASLHDLRLLHGGSEKPPESIEDFFGDAVTRIDVVVPQRTGPTVLEAALQTLTAMSHHYDDQVEVSMTTADTVLPRVGAGQRVVRLQPGAPRPAQVSQRFDLWTLTLQGRDGAVLADSVRDALGHRANDLQPHTTQSLADLGSPRLSLSGWGTTTATVAVPRDVFGPGTTEALDLQLTGSRSAVPSQTSARLDIRLDDFLVESVDLARGQGTDLDVRVRIPGSRLRATSDLEISLTAVPERGCAAIAEALPVELDIDGTLSSLAADLAADLTEPGEVAEPGDVGFQQLPATLGGRATVALRNTGSGLAVAATHAGHLLTALQRAAGLPLDVDLVPANRFLTGSRPGLLIGATDADTLALRAPVRMRSGGGIDSLSAEEPFAALQSVRHRGRQVLVLGAWSPTADASTGLARRIAADTLARGWTSLADNVLVRPATGPEVVLDVAPGPASTEEPEPNTYAPYLLGVAAVLVLLLVVQVGLIIRKDRRTRPSAAPTQDDS